METAQAFLQALFIPSKKAADYRCRLNQLEADRQAIVNKMDHLCVESNVFLCARNVGQKVRMHRLKANGVAQLQWLVTSGASGGSGRVQIIGALALTETDKQKMVFQVLQTQLDDRAFWHQFSEFERLRVSMNYQARCLAYIIKFVGVQENSRSIRKNYERANVH